MITFQTSTGTKAVSNWGYALQGADGQSLSANRLASATHDLLVIDSSRDGTNSGRFSAAEILRMKDGMGGPSVVASYLSISEASDFRDYWDKAWTSGGTARGTLTGLAPDWLGPLNPDWPESRKVRYWDQDWQAIVFNDAGTGTLDAIVRAGFDAAYLDIVDAYHFWGTEASSKVRSSGDPANDRQAAQRMVDFIVALTDHARDTNPRFFVIPQNGAFILDDLGHDPVRRQAYQDAIGGIAVEDLYSPGDKAENNRLDPDREQIAILQKDFLQQGKPVFVVDYLNDPSLVDRFHQQAIQDGFIPYAAPSRDLDRLAGTHDGTAPYKGPTDRADILRGSPLADVIDARAGDDRIEARGGADQIRGGLGNDRINGGDGSDRLFGENGHDRIFGGNGRDSILGGNGNDILAAGSHNDTLAGGNGRDRLQGGSGADILNGGAGGDVLEGGDGADTFVFAAAPGPLHADRIADFDPVWDLIRLDNDVFTMVGGPGRLAPQAFHVGTHAEAADDRIIHDSKSGRLLYDPDGSGSKASVPFAALDAGLKLTAGDFGIID